MRDSLISMMESMMPIMKPLMWVGVAAIVIGFILILAKYVLKKNMHIGVVWSTRIALFVSIFFIAAQVTGVLLSMPPTINFADGNKFEFFIVNFWEIGLVILVVALILKYLGKRANAA